MQHQNLDTVNGICSRNEFIQFGEDKDEEAKTSDCKDNDSDEQIGEDKNEETKARILKMMIDDNENCFLKVKTRFFFF